MKVRDLLQALEAYDPDAEVLLATQEGWPFEHEIEGVVSRAEVGEQGEAGGEATDVLLVEGRQLRYGSKATWRALRR